MSINSLSARDQELKQAYQREFLDRLDLLPKVSHLDSETVAYSPRLQMPIERITGFDEYTPKYGEILLVTSNQRAAVQGAVHVIDQVLSGFFDLFFLVAYASTAPELYLSGGERECTPVQLPRAEPGPFLAALRFSVGSEAAAILEEWCADSTLMLAQAGELGAGLGVECRKSAAPCVHGSVHSIELIAPASSPLKAQLLFWAKATGAIIQLLAAREERLGHAQARVERPLPVDPIS